MDQNETRTTRRMLGCMIGGVIAFWVIGGSIAYVVRHNADVAERAAAAKEAAAQRKEPRSPNR